MALKIALPQERFHNYVNALTALGAEVRFSGTDGCDALLLPGGGDLDPARYGQENRGSLDIDPERDALEFALVQQALEKGLPILGICRGSQLLNVFFGGTLHQDIPDHRATEEGDRLHPSRAEDPMLRSLYGEEFIINSSHHQAVDRPGVGLRPVQWAPDGTVEAIRHETLPVFGVQWHPERLREPTDGWRLLRRWLEEVESFHNDL